MTIENEYASWVKVGGQTIYRKLGFSIGFDGMIRGYRLRSDVDWLSSILESGYYLDFLHRLEDHIFLRNIESEKSWPNTKLIDIDLTNRRLKILYASESSHIDWPVETIAAKKFIIATDISRYGERRGGLLVNIENKVQAEYVSLT